MPLLVLFFKEFLLLGRVCFLQHKNGIAIEGLPLAARTLFCWLVGGYSAQVCK